MKAGDQAMEGWLSAGDGRIKNQPKLVSYWLLLHYLSVNSCFSIHMENRTAAAAVPIDAMSAIIAIFSSRENRLNTIASPSRTNRSTILWAGKPFFDKIRDEAPARI